MEYFLKPGFQAKDLQFKQWLIDQISSGKFKDLEWIDSENKRVFKLPWTKKNYPNWEEHHEIFKAWAQYRSGIRGDPSIANQHITLMKSNFRTILNKSNDIEELKGFHQLDMQTGNYKVYKILTKEEAASKRLRPMIEKGQNIKIEPPNDIIEIKTSGLDPMDSQWLSEPNIPLSWVARSSSLGIALLEAGQSSSKRPHSHDTREVDDCEPQRKLKKTQSTQTVPKDPHFTAKEVIFFPDSGEVVGEHADLLDEHESDVIDSEIIDTDEHSTVADNNEDSSEVVPGFNILLEAAEITADSFVDSSFTDEDSLLKQNCEPSIVDLLKSLSVTREQLSTYDVQVKYGNRQMCSGLYRRMHEGYRIHTRNGKLSERFKEAEYISKKLPDPPFPMGRIFDSVFANLSDGLLLKLDSEYNLVVERLCASTAFVSTNFSDLGSFKNLALPLRKEIVLFSYSQFFKKLLLSMTTGTKNAALPLSDLNIFISIGKKVRNEKGNVLIGIQIFSKAAEIMLELAQQARGKS